MRDAIVKVIKMPFANAKPEDGYVLHATSEYVIGGEKEKKEEVKEETKTEVKTDNKAKKPEQKGPNKENKKKNEVKIEKEEKSEPAENVIISIYKKN